MGLIRTTAPSADPVTLAEAKSHLRVDTSDDDALISRLIKAATEMLDGADGQLGRALVTQSWRLELDAFPCTRPVELPLPPLQTVESITYLDRTGAEITLDAAAYRVTGTGGASFARIVPTPGTRWPVTFATPGAVSIAFTAGYGAPAAVPEALRNVILANVAALYAQREALVLSNFGASDFSPVSAVIEAYRVPWC